MNTLEFRRVDEMIKEAQNKDLGVNKNGSCDVYVDMSLLNNFKDNSHYSEEDDNQFSNEDSVKNLKLLGLKSSMDKDERIFKLQTMVSKGEIKTVQQAEEEFGVSKSTIIKYLSEIKMSLKDESTNKRVGFINTYSSRKDSSKSGFNYLDPITKQPISKIQHKKNIELYQQEKRRLSGEV